MAGADPQSILVGCGLFVLLAVEEFFVAKKDFTLLMWNIFRERSQEACHERSEEARWSLRAGDQPSGGRAADLFQAEPTLPPDTCATVFSVNYPEFCDYPGTFPETSIHSESDHGSRR